MWHSCSKALDAEEVWYSTTIHSPIYFISDKNKHREKISLCTKKSQLSLYKWPNYAKINKLFKMLFSLSVKRYQHVTISANLQYHFSLSNSTAANLQYLFFSLSNCTTLRVPWQVVMETHGNNCNIVFSF